MTADGRSTTPARGVVVALVSDMREQASVHEQCTLLGYAQRLAALRGDEAAGFHDPAMHYPGHLYFVPGHTLDAGEARALGIAGVEDLFGGVVPHAFVGSKAITHGLVRPGAAAVAGWNADLAAALGDAVLAGFTAFDPADALEAGARLLARGPVRLKPPPARGGQRQQVVRDAGALARAVSALDEGDLAARGLVLEEDLAQAQTFSVGQVCVAGLVASYFGSQRTTRNNEGAEVFGGSELTVVRGGFDALAALHPPAAVRRAVDQARRYDAAVHDAYPGFFASRCNYDILVGRDASGALRSAVLEQSWRAGGATGPEIAALEAFRSDPQRQVVRARCVEIYGASPEPPPHATAYFRGIDPRVGPLTKYTVTEPDDHTR